MEQAIMTEHPAKTLTPNSPSRRAFLAAAGTAAAAACFSGCSSSVATLPTVTTYDDVDLLNFVLNLSYLQAEFYLRAATGAGLSTADAGAGAGTVNGGAKITGLTTFQQNAVDEFAYAEQQHVRYLQGLLGSAAVPRPTIDFTNGFTAIATVANSLSAASTTVPALPIPFNPFATFDYFMVAGAALEDMAVSGILYQLPNISPAGVSSGYLSGLSALTANRAYHAAFFRSMLIQNAVTQGDTAYQFPLYFNRIVAFITSITQTTEIALGGYTTTAATLSNVGTSATANADTTNSLGVRRTSDQILHFLYATYSGVAGSLIDANGVAGGGLFPSGLNGNISATQS